MKTTRLITMLLCAAALLATASLLRADEHKACCDATVEAGLKCKHECCVDAAKAAKVCEKCHTAKKEDKKGEKKDKE